MDKVVLFIGFVLVVYFIDRFKGLLER